MEMRTGQLYAPRYSGRKTMIYRVKHIAGTEVIMELWEFDKKTRVLKLVDKYVPMDTEYFKNKSDAEGIVPITGEFKEELDLPLLPE